MSWTIDLVDYSEARTGTAAYTISEFEMNLDPNSITGVDYFKQESRLCNITFFQNSSIDLLLTPFLEGTGNILYTHSFYWKYVCRIKYNNSIQYIGYLRRDGVNIDNNNGKYSFRLSDISGVLFNLAKEFNWLALTTPTQIYGVRGLLYANINYLMGDSSGVAIHFDSYTVDNYDLTSGLQVDDIELYNKNSDEQLLAEVGNIDLFNWFVDDVVVITSTVTIGTVAQHAVIYVEDDTTKVVLMKYTQALYAGGYSLFEKIYVKTFNINNDIWIVEQDLSVQTTNQTFISVAGAVGYANALNLYEPYYSDLGYPVVDVFDLTVGNDNYHLAEDANELNYDGITNFYEVVMNTSKDRTVESDIKMLLLMNNLSLYIHNDGIIEIINKTTEIGGSTTISDADIISLSQSGIIKATPDYNSVNSNMIEVNQNVVSNAEKDYYEDLFDSLVKEISIQIENKYDLSLNQVIVVYGSNYKISSIHLDNYRFVYTIKAWGV